MSYYYSNLNLLKRIEPDLVRRLERVEASGAPQKADFTLFQNLDLRKTELLILLGPIIAFHQMELLRKTIPHTFILAIEHSLSEFKSALERVNLKPILTSRRVSVAVEEPPWVATHVRLDQNFGVLTCTNIKIIEHPSILPNPYYQEVKRYLLDVKDGAAQNAATLSHFSDIWQRHILENLPQIIKCPGVNLLFERFSNKPAILVSAGPSLDKNVKDLMLAEGYALIICVDTALRTLLKHSIEPDIVVSIDAEERNCKHFSGIELKNTSLIASPLTHPQILKHHQGPIFITDYGHPLMQWIEQFIGGKGFTRTGGCVATTGFDLARRFGAEPIIFVGQDFSFPHPLYTHTIYSSTMDELMDSVGNCSKFWTLEMAIEERLRELQEELIWVDGVEGGKVMTTRQMYGWFRWLQSQIRESGIKCVNATEGGAKMEGVEIMKLREAILRYCKKKVKAKKTISECIPLYSHPPLDGLLLEMKKMQEEWCFIIRLAELGRWKAEKLCRNFSSHQLGEVIEIYKQILGFKRFSQINKWDIKALRYKVKKKLPNSTLPMRYKAFFEGISNILRHALPTIEEAERLIKKI
jgi:hypothetical protein